MSAFAREMAAFRVKNPAQVQADADALLARVDRDFDSLDAVASLGLLHDVGALEDRRKSLRHPSGGQA